MTRSGPPSSEDHDRVADLFARALDVPAEHRAVFLDEACEGDAALRADVDALLAVHDTGDEFLRPLAPSIVAGILAGEATVLRPGERVSHWRILRELGHGGMGSVHLAERADGQFQQRVAIKIVRPGLFDPSLLQRFLRERRILARLEHPNIARLLDGGVLADGRPYLVMEYVEGQPLDRACDGRNLSLERRLFLFEQICGAVAYAHRNLVVHRDLKPANILVARDGSVKLLDFGVARLLESDGEEGDAITRTGTRVLTPEYASPEQFLGEPVSTASDIYSLGVLLYEMLTGIRAHAWSGTLPNELRRTALRGTPPRPSEALLAGAALPPGVDANRLAAARGLSTDSLRRRLRGDLDDIVLTAMRREPDARYASVEALRADIRRHLAGLPVSARPATLRYRAGKFIARNRMPVTATLLVLVAVLAGVAATVAQSRATAREGRRAARIQDFLVEVFAISDPDRAQGGDVTARELLDRGTERVRTDLEDQPALQADMLAVLGTVYRRLGLYADARPQLEDALRLRRSTGASPHDVAESLTDLASVLVTLDEYDAAETLIREALEIRRTTDGRDSPEVAAVSLDLAAVHRARGELEEAEPLYRQALAIHRSARDSLAMADDLNGLGLLLSDRGHTDEAIAALAEAVAIRRAIQGTGHSEYARSLCNLAAAFEHASDYDAAALRYRECIAIRRRILAADHPDLGLALNNLGNMYLAAGDLDEAEPLLLQGLEIRRAAYGENHTAVAGSLNNLAVLAYRRGDIAGAAARFRELAGVWRALVGPEHPNTLATLNNLGVTLRDSNDLEGAIVVLQDVVGTRARVLGENHTQTAEAMLNLAVAIERQGRRAEAETMLRDALARLEAAHPDGHTSTASVAANLGRMLVEDGRFADAIPPLERAVEIRTERLGEEHAATKAAAASLDAARRGAR